MKDEGSANNTQFWPPVTDEQFHYLDEKSLVLRGWPGYRTRPGRSGLDPLDNEFELAQMEGKFIRALISGKLDPRGPIAVSLP
jgi:hypothetical protein